MCDSIPHPPPAPSLPHPSPCPSSSLSITIAALEALPSHALVSRGLMSLDTLADIVRGAPHALDLITIEPKDALKTNLQHLRTSVEGGRVT